MKTKKISYLIYFLAGSLLYPCIELLWRGRTHFSMALLGGLSLVFIVWIDRQLKKGLFLQKAFLSTIVITQMEWIFGVILNLHLKLGIWDYSGERFNLAGQICPLFSLYWFLLSLFVIILLDFEKEFRKNKLPARH